MRAATPFTEEHDQLRTTLRRVVADEIAPEVDRWERSGRIDDAVFRRLGELGFMGSGVAVEHGGQGGDPWSSVVIAEELARGGSASLARIVTDQTEVAVPLLVQAATDRQRRHHLTPALAGERRIAVAAGRDGPGREHGDTAVIAEPHDDGWSLTGRIEAVTGGTGAHLLLLAARTAAPDTTDPSRGLTLFLVPTERTGVELATGLDRVGLRASGTADLHLDGVHVGAEDLLGEEGRAALLLGHHLSWRRLTTAAGAVATAQILLERALSYTRQRRAFGRPIADLQVTRHTLADLATRIAESRALVHGTVDVWLQGVRSPERVAMAKLAASTLVFDVADEVLQLHGGNGYAQGYGVELAWRDARFHRIDGGSDEQLREAIARHLRDRSAVLSATGSTPVGDGAGAQGRGTPPRQEVTGTRPEPALPLFGPEHDALRERARAFVASQITPHVEDWERAEHLPREVFRTVGAAGYLGLRFAPDVGGSGPDHLAQAVWVEELARCLSGGVAADLGASTDLAGTYIDAAGTPDQRDRFLPGLITGERIGALAITEPGAGSDVAGITTRARRDGDAWILDGAKVFITNGPWADHLVVAAKVAPQDGAPGDSPHAQLTLFVVDGDAPGVTRRRLSMLGWRSSHTGELTFDDVAVADDRRLGAIGSGFAHITAAFAWERLVLALGAVSAADRTLELILDLDGHRRVFAEAGGSEAWRHRLADLATRLEAARALTYQALRLLVSADHGGQVTDAEVVRMAAMAKLRTQRLAFEVADTGLQLHGASGLRMDSPLQRAWRDARLGPIGGGTDQIMREIIGRTL